ncbi:B-cell receptor CD22 [Anoplopoma fimbria]|uniref:B-cell receptor CD22 n=1 Tax=Anoplopoma fimbria TaxID=229290 RepID=UPI0023EB9E04|nr:B-cell receptor CD22 [Anoplopoma fimbria]
MQQPSEGWCVLQTALSGSSEISSFSATQKMNAQTVGWLVFLAIIKNFSFGQRTIPFELVDKHQTATEGSCIEIKCRVSQKVTVDDAYWFWIKNAIWNNGVFNGTVIYSTNNITQPVSADFADRVKYIGSSPSLWNSNGETSPECSILICDLKIPDNGNYSFRFVGASNTRVWITKPAVKLEVKENPCLITFEKPPVVNEGDTVTLTCSTLSSCSKNPQIGDLTELFPTPLSKHPENGQKKSTAVSFTVDWQDDGKVFSCWTNVSDKHLIRNISLTVEYSPKELLAKISPENIVERQTVTLTCSAKGRPDPTFTWFNNKRAVNETGAVWKIPSIKESQNGEYHCEAKNKQGTIPSNLVTISVEYAPEVEVISPAQTFEHRTKMNLTCNVKRSNPQPLTYVWFKDNKVVDQRTKQYVVERVEPEDSGSYNCKATNAVGNGKSEPLNIEVEYGPRKTKISTSEDVRVEVGNRLTFYCNTEANPAPLRYSWYRYNKNEQTDSSQWKFKTTQQKELRLDSVKRADEACYVCNATNRLNTGEDSESVCIEVLYAPTELMLSMDTEVSEDQLIIIRCTVESFPPSKLTLTWTSEANNQTSKFTQSDNERSPNTLRHEFNATSTHAGFYICKAENTKGSSISEKGKLMVKYRPKDVTVKAQPALVVNESQSLTLDCGARSYPPVTSVIWRKITDGKSKILQKMKTFILKSVSPSDSGLYSCEASNDIGTGTSQRTEVKVKYAPKHTNILTVAEQEQPNGMSYIQLRCSSESYPPVTQYTWYKIKGDEERDEKLSDNQIFKVYSNQPGVYYCIAKNEINQRSSDPVHLFEGDFMKTLLIIIFVIILLIFLLIVAYRHRKKKKLGQQGTRNILCCFGFPGWWNGAWRRNRLNDPGVAEPFRSRDDLLPDKPHRPKAQRCQTRPDTTPASNISSVYCTVNLPSGQEGPPAPKIIRQQGGDTQEDSVTYASLHFGNKQENKWAKTEVDVYTEVSKPPKKNEERLEDYENVSAVDGARAPCPVDYDTDTSEDDVQINYSQVSFKPKPGHQQVSSDSSTSDEDETQYSEVKI